MIKTLAQIRAPTFTAGLVLWRDTVIEAAPIILRKTGLVHGRPGKPNSHWWYHCEDIRTAQFTDVDPHG